MNSSASEFRFKGRISGSKSILNRLLILKSFEPNLEIDGDSQADDVVKMKSALAQLMRGELADCGAAGTTLRFLAFRAARLPGTHHLSGSLRLFSRPQMEIGRVLNQLGCKAEFGPQRLTITGGGWSVPSDGVRIDRSVSSQFASALVLSAWGLDRDLKIHFDGEAVSEGYLQMTLEIVRQAGMSWRKEGDSTIVIPAQSRIRPGAYMVEPDISSAFAVAALAALRGHAIIEGWPEKSLQPDSVFPDFLREMGCRVEVLGTDVQRALLIERPSGGDLRPLHKSLLDCPDLFPVLATLCAHANGISRLEGAPQLEYKESSRIKKTAELIEMIGRKVERIPGGLEIHGSARALVSVAGAREFDPDHDHRLAMAAALAREGGSDVTTLRPDVVNKSFPEFWNLLAK
jgi:3-phosphoshikimate 1-carboxyvinyltransferase